MKKRNPLEIKLIKIKIIKLIRLQTMQLTPAKDEQDLTKLLFQKREGQWW